MLTSMHIRHKIFIKIFVLYPQYPLSYQHMSSMRNRPFWAGFALFRMLGAGKENRTPIF